MIIRKLIGCDKPFAVFNLDLENPNNDVLGMIMFKGTYKECKQFQIDYNNRPL